MSIQTTTLANGMRVITDHMDSVQSVSLGTWVEVGARHETPDLNGISHFLEHMAFKGTTRRNALELAETIEDVGGHINAYTSRENTAYYVKVLKDDVELAVDVIADILQNSVMDEEEVERERSVILQEIYQANDTPDDIIFDHFQTKAYPDQAMGRPVLGEAENVQTLSRDVILNYMKTHYTAKRMVFAAAGNVDHDQLVQLVEQKFTQLNDDSELAVDPSRYRGGHYEEKRDNLDQVQVVIGFDAVEYSDPDFYALSLMSTLFGGGMSSRLFQEIREKRGLVYSVYSFVSAYDDGGMLAIYAGTGPDQVAELLPAIAGEMKKVCAHVTEQELARARAQLKSSILMSLESTSTRCEQLARQLIVFGRPISVEEVVEKIDMVTAADICRISKKIFASTPTLATLGPKQDMPSYEDFVTMCAF